MQTVTNSIPVSDRIFNGSKELSIELTSNAVGITVRITYIVIAIPKVEPLLIPGMRLLPNVSFDSLANPLVHDLQ